MNDISVLKKKVYDILDYLHCVNILQEPTSRYVYYFDLRYQLYFQF